MGFDSITRTHVGLRRKCNEDSVLGQPERAIWAVADGMGGHDAGDVASARIVGALGALPESLDLDAHVAAAVSALRQVNAELVELAQGESARRTIGSTVVGLVIGDGEYRCFWAGDSRAYHLCNDELLQITRDHSLVQGLVEAGMVEQADAETHPNANVVTRAVGAGPHLELEVASGTALPGDRFLLASDGLTRMVAPPELLAALSGGSLDEAGDSLVATVLDRGAPDNVTLALIRVL